MKKNSALILITVVSLLASCAPDNETTTSDDRDKFVGTWLCTDSSYTDNSKITYSVSVEKSGDGNTVHINNFYKLGASTYVTAEVSGNSIVIPSQTDDDYTMSGSGYYSKEKFSLTYSAQIGSSIDNCYAVYE